VKGKEEDDEVNQRGRYRLSDVNPKRLRKVHGSEAPATPGTSIQVPHGRDGVAWYPRQDTEKNAPDGRETDEPLAEEPPS